MGAIAAEESIVKKLTAVCGKDGIKVSVRFSSPFKGVVYSDGKFINKNMFIHKSEASLLENNWFRHNLVCEIFGKGKICFELLNEMIYIWDNLLHDLNVRVRRQAAF